MEKVLDGGGWREEDCYYLWWYFLSSNLEDRLMSDWRMATMDRRVIVVNLILWNEGVDNLFSMIFVLEEFFRTQLGSSSTNSSETSSIISVTIILLNEVALINNRSTIYSGWNYLPRELSR